MGKDGQGIERWEEYKRLLREKHLDWCIHFTNTICVTLLAVCTHGPALIWSVFAHQHQPPLRVWGRSGLGLYDFLTFIPEMILLSPLSESRGRAAQWDDWYRRTPRIIAVLVFIAGNIMQWFDSGYRLGFYVPGPFVQVYEPMLRQIYYITVITVRVVLLLVANMIIYICYRQKTNPTLEVLNSRMQFVRVLTVVLLIVATLIFANIIAPRLPQFLYF